MALAAGTRCLTIGCDAVFTGRALFTGGLSSVRLTSPSPDGPRGVSVWVHEAPPPGPPELIANLGFLSGSAVHPAFASVPPRHTVLGRPGLTGDGPMAATVEHLLAAVELAHVTDLRVHLTRGREVPILDGSALDFFDALIADRMEHGEDADAEDATIRPARVIRVEDGRGGSITIEPSEGLELRYELEFPPSAARPVPVIAAHAAEIDLLQASVDTRRRLASARTFSLASEARQMQALGLFAGLTPADLVVVQDDPTQPGFGEPIDNAWRFAGEPAAHKLLDLIGDLALIDRPLRARVVARRAGHALNHAAARALVEAAG